MKNTIKSLTLLMLIIASISACKKDDPAPAPAPEVMKLPTEMNYISPSGNASTYTFKYDNLDHLTRITFEDDYFEFNYNGDKIDDILYYNSSTSTLTKYMEFRYSGDQLDEIDYDFSPVKTLDVSYNSTTRTYNLKDGTIDLQYTFADEDLLNLDHIYGTNIQLELNSNKNMFYALTRTDATTIAYNLTLIGGIIQFTNKHLYDEIKPGADVMSVMADYDIDGYPTKIVWTRNNGDREQFIISY